jgi:hypothetical protein
MASSPPRDGDDTRVASDRREGMPRWVRVSVIIVILGVLAVVLVMLIGGGGGGGHGPSRHGLGAESAEQIVAKDASGDHGPSTSD